jgi:glycosyltransferase involved in cell wall biosynthesis
LPLSIAVILKGYPRLSETFIAQEIRELECRGLDITIISLRHPTDTQIHPIHSEIQAPVIYLPEYLYQEPWRVLKGLASAACKPSFFALCGTWLNDLRRDCSLSRIRRFGQALVLARELPDKVQHLYAHFIHTPTSVTRYAASLSGHTWSASAHAKDIWTIPAWEIKEKLDDMQWLATCTQANTDYLQSLADEPKKVNLVYHGIDFTRFNHKAKNDDGGDRSGDDNGNESSNESGEHPTTTPVQIISVGRAVAKKGYDNLFNALSRLPKDLNWQFIHIGGGSLQSTLKQQVEQLHLQDRVQWLGALPQEQVLQHYRQADFFVLASKVVGDGDRDGLPNVLMEAQSQGLCCLSTNISGIPELIINGETGLLVEQNDEAALQDALHTLIGDSALRQKLGTAGYQRVTHQFSVNSGIDQLMELFSSLAIPLTPPADVTTE